MGTIESTNPTTGLTLQRYTPHDDTQIAAALSRARATFAQWRRRSFADRASLFLRLSALLHERKHEYAKLMADEMGKVLRDGVAEIEKCATATDFYAKNAEAFLANRAVVTDAKESHVAFDPLGVVLAIMPWNFPFWQVIRFASPTLMAGNVGVLKHASNVSGCALAIEALFRDAGFPEGVMSTLLVPGSETEKIIRHPAIQAISLTGSTPAGRAVASVAGSVLKKCVLELGGSDAYVVLEDADLEHAVETCVKSRLINGGQSCISAKRFIVVASLYQEFERRFVDKFKSIRFGDPSDSAADYGPMARRDLRDDLHLQVMASVRQGARLCTGGFVPEGPGAFYPATILSDVKPGMVAFDEELFGPVAALIEARDEDEAIRLANLSNFGLGGAIFTSDKSRAERLVRELDAGSVFVNAFVKSDVRLPFGGIKDSGFGRELSSFGIHEFVNTKTVYHGR